MKLFNRYNTVAVLYLLPSIFVACWNITNEEHSRAPKRARLNEEFLFQDFPSNTTQYLNLYLFDPSESFDFLKTDDVSLEDLTESLSVRQSTFSKESRAVGHEQQELPLLELKESNNYSREFRTALPQAQLIAGAAPNTLLAQQTSTSSSNDSRTKLQKQNPTRISNSKWIEIPSRFVILDEDLHHATPNTIGSQERHKLFEEKKFRIQATFRSLSIEFGTDSFEKIFAFKYTIRLLDLLELEKEKTKHESYLVVVANLGEIFPVLSELPLHLRPFYYACKTRFNRNKSMNFYSRAPLYFLFTSISFLIQNENASNYPKLKELVDKAFFKCIQSNQFLFKRWNSLREFGNDYGIFKGKNCPKKVDMFHDISSVSFIYSQMRHPDEKIKTFFTETWKVYKSNFIRLTCNSQRKSLVLKIAYIDKVRERMFSRAAKLLYQIKFTKMIFSNWESIDDLLLNYSQLRDDFEPIDTDFRRRVFSRGDFEKLVDAILRIRKLVDGCSEITDALKAFLTELEYFASFKSFLFAYDFCTEFAQKPDCAKYLKTFEKIKKISEAFLEMRSYLSSEKGISLDPAEIAIRCQCKNDSCLSLGELADKFIAFINYTDLEIYRKVDYSPRELNSFIKEFPYFQENFSYLTLSRFRCAEFSAELEEILESGSEDDVNGVFTSKKYEPLMGFLQFNSEEISRIKTPESRRHTLEHLQTYLQLYNQ